MFKITQREIIIISFLLLAMFLFESFRFNESQKSTDNISINKTDKIPGGKEIPTSEAYELIGNYRNLHKAETDRTIYKTTGWQINKTAIENIFNNPEMHSLSFDLVEQEGTLKLILKGSQIQMSGIQTDVGNSIFIVQSFCPSDCSNIN